MITKLCARQGHLGFGDIYCDKAFGFIGYKVLT
jgi:hypothetical protein